MPLREKRRFLFLEEEGEGFNGRNGIFSQRPFGAFFVYLAKIFFA